MANEQLSAEIKAFRASNALSQEQLARRLNVSTGSVRNWERGVRPLQVYRQRLAALLAGGEVK